MTSFAKTGLMLLALLGFNLFLGRFFEKDMVTAKANPSEVAFVKTFQAVKVFTRQMQAVSARKKQLAVLH